MSIMQENTFSSMKKKQDPGESVAISFVSLLDVVIIRASFQSAEISEFSLVSFMKV